MARKKTIIFFPIDTGLAHITRCAAIAEKLTQSEMRVIFALAKSKQHLVKSKDLEIVDLEEFFADEQDLDKLKDPKYLSPLILEELKILKKYKPDLAVIDYRFSAIIACKKANTKVVLITNSDGLPPKIYLPDFGFFPYVQKLANPLFQKVIWHFKSKYLSSLLKVAKWLDLRLTLADLYNETIIVPEPVGYLPSSLSNRIHYVGYTRWNGFNNNPPWLKSIKPDGKTIYLTFGGTGYDSKKLTDLSEKLIEKGYRVIVSSSNIAKPDDFIKHDNLYVEKFLPGLEVCKRVDLVVCHGGVGTLFQALMAAKPVLIVPFNPDQYIHAFRFQELGLGKCVTNASIAQLLKIDWDHFLSLGRFLQLDKVLKAIDRLMLEKNSYKKALEEYREKFTKIDGTEEAARLIKEMVK